jgi:hypothetical protein
VKSGGGAVCLHRWGKGEGTREPAVREKGALRCSFIAGMGGGGAPERW